MIVTGKKKQLWRAVLAIAAVIVVVGLAVGLSVGLTCRNENDDEESAIDFTTIVDMLIVGGTVVTVNDQLDVLTNSAVYVDELGLIADIGDAGTLRDLHKPDFELQLEDDDILLPGFINTHGHVCMTALGDVADDMELSSWLTQVIFPLEGKLVTADFCKPSFTLGVAEMVQSGTTTFVDVYFFEDQMAKLVEQIGVRAVLCESVINFPQPDFATPNDTLEFAEGFLQDYEGT